MWRTRDWKLITYLPGDVAGAGRREPRGELYDLRADPHEYKNLYDDPGHLSIRDRLTGELLMHLALAWGKYPWQAAKPQLA
ncbi:MAG: DUF4976 domain-containing protein [Actinomycetota bacterium]|nr:DUF4976 domain-containing protein [Actinomycetota bacterium]